MVIDGNENAYVFTKKIEWENSDGTTDFIEVREFNMQELQIFQSKVKKDDKIDEIETLKTSTEMLKDCIINSSFIHSDGTKCNKNEVYNFIKRSSALCSEIIGIWLDESDKTSPFTLVKSKKTK